jgi:hypothetical protein
MGQRYGFALLRVKPTDNPLATRPESSNVDRELRSRPRRTATRAAAALRQ